MKITKMILDGWQNLITGAGIANVDSKMSTTVVRDGYLNREDAFALYQGDMISGRAVNIYVAEATRRGFKVIGDTDGVVNNYYRKKGFKKAVKDIYRWAKVYGGAVGVIIADDGADNLEEPLNEEKLIKIEKVKVYDRHQVERVVSTDEDSEYYGDYEFLTVTPTSGAPFKVHVSRTLIIDGEALPDNERVINNSWGMSFLQNRWKAFKKVSVVFDNCESIMDEFVTGVLSIKNLQEMIAEGREQQILQRLHIMDITKHIINMTLLDERETYTKETTSVAGLAEIIDRLMMFASAISAIPGTLLFGKTIQGLSNENRNDTRNWYDVVSTEQEEYLLPIDERLLYLIQKSKEGPTKGVVNDEWSIEYETLWQQTEKEEAETRKLTAETDKIYYDIGALLPHQITRSRFGGEDYSSETNIPDEELKLIEELNSNEDPE